MATTIFWFAGYAAIVFSCFNRTCRAEDADLAVSREHGRRTGAPCATMQYGPYTGILTVDTGAPETIVFGPRSLFDAPEKKWRISSEQVRFLNGVRGVTRISNIDVSVFDVPSEETSILYRESQYMEKVGVRTDGYLGVRQFPSMPLRLNLRNHVCQPFVGDDFAVNATLLPVVAHGVNTPRVVIELPIVGHRHATFDTGFGRSLTLNKKTIGLLERAGMLRSGPILHGMTIGGPIESQTHILRSVKLGGYEFQDVQVAEQELELIGCELFQAFDMVLDLSHDKIWLKPHEKDWPVRVFPDASGLVMTYYDANLLKVVRMQPDSPAIHCGLQEGDQVLTFDGKMPKELSMLEIRKCLTQAGTTIALKILRENEELQIDLPLSYSFEYPPRWPEVKSDADDFFKSLQDQKPDSN